MSQSNLLFLNIEDIRAISLYNFYIPMVRQLHHKFIAERFPGWSWSELLPRIQGAKIVRTHIDCHRCTRLSMGLCMDAEIEGVWIKRNPSGIRVKAVRKGEKS